MPASVWTLRNSQRGLTRKVSSLVILTLSRAAGRGPGARRIGGLDLGKLGALGRARFAAEGAQADETDGPGHGFLERVAAPEVRPGLRLRLVGFHRGLPQKTTLAPNWIWRGVPTMR